MRFNGSITSQDASPCWYSNSINLKLWTLHQYALRIVSFCVTEILYMYQNNLRLSSCFYSWFNFRPGWIELAMYVDIYQASCKTLVKLLFCQKYITLHLTLQIQQKTDLCNYLQCSQKKVYKYRSWYKHKLIIYPAAQDTQLSNTLKTTTVKKQLHLVVTGYNNVYLPSLSHINVHFWIFKIKKW